MGNGGRTKVDGTSGINDEKSGLEVNDISMEWRQMTTKEGWREGDEGDRQRLPFGEDLFE